MDMENMDYPGGGIDCLKSLKNRTAPEQPRVSISLFCLQTKLPSWGLHTLVLNRLAFNKQGLDIIRAWKHCNTYTWYKSQNWPLLCLPLESEIGQRAAPFLRGYSVSLRIFLFSAVVLVYQGFGVLVCVFGGVLGERAGAAGH